MAIRNFKFPGVELNQVFEETPTTSVSQLGVVIVGQQYKLIKADLDDEDRIVSWTYDETDATVPLDDLPGYKKADEGETQTQTLDTAWNKSQVVVKNAAFLNYTAKSETTEEATSTVDISNEIVTLDGSSDTVKNEIDIAHSTACVPLTTTIVDSTAEEVVAAFGYRTPEIGDNVVISGSTGIATCVITAIKRGSYTLQETSEPDITGSTETSGTDISGSTETTGSDIGDTTETTTVVPVDVIFAKILSKSDDFTGTTATAIDFIVTQTTTFAATAVIDPEPVEDTEAEDVVDTPDADVPDAGDDVSGDDVSEDEPEVVTVAGLRIDEASLSVPGKTEPIALMAGTYTVSVTCRYKDTAYVGKLGSVDDYTAIEKIFGDIAVDNPMALALLFAVYAASNNIVYFTAVANDTVKDYVRAMDFLNRYEMVYSVVPMIVIKESALYDENDVSISIIKNILTNAVASSENSESKIRRTVWYGLETPTGYADTTDMVNALVALREGVSTNYRAQAVWADGAYFNGEEIPNYILAAAPAGMRSYEPTYRPISNLPYTFFSLKNANGFTSSDLITLGSNGIWIIDNNYEGTPRNKKQVTTAVSDNLNLDEESIVANADSIALTLCHIGEDLVGCSNISPALIKSLSDTITAIMDNYLINRTGNIYIGPQLLSWSLDAMYQHEVLLDHIYAVITCEPPKPFNRFVMTLRIV